jgi:hypothetical protein
MSNHINRTLLTRSIYEPQKELSSATIMLLFAGTLWLVPIGSKRPSQVTGHRDRKIVPFPQIDCLLSCESKLLQIFGHLRCSKLSDISAIGCGPSNPAYRKPFVNLASYLTFRHFRLGEKQKPAGLAVCVVSTVSIPRLRRILLSALPITTSSSKGLFIKT